MSANEALRQHRGFVVAGLGKMGIMHASMLGVVSGGRVAALVDIDEKLGRNVQSMGVDAPVYTDINKCLDEIAPDGVWITTPQFVHRQLFELCVSRGIPVFCEKPLAHTLEDARKMAAAAAARPELPIAVGYMTAHNPLFHKAHDLVAAGELGQACSFKASTRLSQVFSPMKGWTFTKEQAGGGVLINSGCHLLMALHVLFGPPARVTVKGRGVHNQVEDTLGAIFEYANGLWGMIEITWSVPGHELQTHDIEVLGTAGTIEVGNEALRLWLHQKTRNHPAGWSQWLRSRTEPLAEFSLSPEYCGDEFFLEDQDFVNAVRKGGRPKVGLAEAMAIQELLEAMYRSMAENRPVDLASVVKS
ncbi:MAG: Gfo/Idh/MocA family oxidoreductase [Candidatus Sumerlaeia bacterium]